MRKKGILPFLTTGMDIDSIMLSEISQRKTNTVWYHLKMKSKNKAKPVETEEMVVPKDWWVEEMERWHLREQTSRWISPGALMISVVMIHHSVTW